MALKIKQSLFSIFLLLNSSLLFAHESIYREEILKISSTLTDKTSRESALIEWLYGYISCTSLDTANTCLNRIKTMGLFFEKKSCFLNFDKTINCSDSFVELETMYFLYDQTLRAYENTALVYNSQKYLSYNKDSKEYKNLNWAVAHQVFSARSNSKTKTLAYCGFDESCVAALYLLTHL